MNLKVLIETYMFKLASRIDPEEQYDEAMVKGLANALYNLIREEK